MHVGYSGFRPSTVIIYFYGCYEIRTQASLAGHQLSTAQCNHAGGAPDTLLTSA